MAEQVPTLQGGSTMRRIYDTLDVENTPRFPTQAGLHAPYDALIEKKKQLLKKQKTHAIAIHSMLTNMDVSLFA